MAKTGMRLPNPKAQHGKESNHKPHHKYGENQVPEIQGKEKN